MALQTWVNCLTAGQIDGTAVANSTSETTILAPHQKIILPSNYFNSIGQSLRLLIWGRLSCIVTTPGTLTMKVKLGPTANIAVATTQALQLNTTAQTNDTFWLRFDLTLRSIGASTSATFMWAGQMSSVALGTGAVTPVDILLPATAPAVGTGFDSTVANTFDCTATFSIANAGNSIQMHMATLESLN